MNLVIRGSIVRGNVLVGHSLGLMLSIVTQGRGLQLMLLLTPGHRIHALDMKPFSNLSASHNSARAI
jgi:hypothetical protein